MYTIGLKSDGTLVHTCIDNSISKLGNIAVPIDVSTKKELETERQKRTEISRKKQAEERKKEEETKKQQETYRNTGVCQYCGGSFKGIFSKVCTQCGKKKDY